MEPLSIRKAQKEDMHLLFEWANEPLTRANSTTQGEILWEDHQAWFLRKLDDPNCFVYISAYQSQPVGMLRMDCQDLVATISYSIDKSHRGKGLGKKTLEAGINLFLKESSHAVTKIEALVKPNNIASVKTFEKLGFLRIGDREIKGVRLWVYERKV